MTIYIIKSSISLIVLFGLYWLFLRKEKIFRFNRFFLLAAVMVSLFLPLVSVPVDFGLAPKIPVQAQQGNTTVKISNKPDVLQGPVSELSENSNRYHNNTAIAVILLALYLSGVLLLTYRFIKNIFRIRKLLRGSEKIIHDGFSISLTEDQTGPCCFFNRICISRESFLKRNFPEELLEHEMEHVRQRHTIDIILIELVKIFYWFNPVIFLYERAMRINHEYLADSAVVTGNYDIKEYAESMLNFIIRRSDLSLTSFSEDTYIRKRLLMMAKSASGKLTNRVRMISVVCSSLIMMLLMSFRDSGSLPVRDEGASLTGTLGIDTAKLISYKAKTIVNYLDSNRLTTMTGNVSIVWYPENGSMVNIEADSAAYVAIPGVIYAYRGKMTKMNFGNSELPDSIAFEEMSIELSTGKVKAGHIRSSIHVLAPIFEKPELFPVAGMNYAKMSKAYGWYKFKKESKDTSAFHYGIDFKVPLGTEIIATAGGTVKTAKWEENGMGRCVKIDHGGGYQSIYAHLNDYTVKEGDFVKKGQVIGHSGSSGLSTGPHLHFQINVNGETVNPIHYLK